MTVLEQAAPDLETGRWTVGKLLKEAHRLGVPSFQRGAVWPDEQKGEFLRSLSKGYFCGTILLWPHGGADGGAVPLVAGGGCEALLIDGQQRVRALLEVLGGLPSWAALPKPPGKPPDQRREDPLWSTSVDPNSSSGLLFKRHAYRGNAPHHDWLPLALVEDARSPVVQPGVQAHHDWLPLALSGDPLPETLAYEYRPFERGAASAKDGETVWKQIPFVLKEWQPGFSRNVNSKELLSRCKALLEVELDVKVLPHSWSLAQVVDNYRRLNEGGSPLREEEVDFAFLAEHVRDVNDRLSKIARSRVGGPGDVVSEEPTQGEAREEDASVASTREWLARGEDRDFGLKLFVRAVRLARDHWASRPDETEWSLEDSYKKTGRGDQAGAVKAHLEAWSKAASEAVEALSRAIEANGCDHRPCIPRNKEVFGILLRILIRFPALRESTGWANAQVRMLVLGLFLAPVPLPEGLPALVDTSTSACDVLARLGEVLEVLLPRENILEAAEKSQSMQSHYVKLFYWWLRSHKAHDIPGPEEMAGLKRPLQGSLAPQRQHILPYSRMSCSGGRRPGRQKSHAINSLGNLTWISAKSNGLEGWCDKPMQVPTDLAQEHLLGKCAEYEFSSGEKIPEDGVKKFAKARAKEIGEALADHWEKVRAQARDCARPEDGGASPEKTEAREGHDLDRFARWEWPPELARAAFVLCRLATTRRSTSWKNGQGVRFAHAGSRANGDSDPPVKVLVRGLPGCEDHELISERERLKLLAPTDTVVWEHALPSEAAAATTALNQLLLQHLGRREAVRLLGIPEPHYPIPAARNPEPRP